MRFFRLIAARLLGVMLVSLALASPVLAAPHDASHLGSSVDAFEHHHHDAGSIVADHDHHDAGSDPDERAAGHEHAPIQTLSGMEGLSSDLVLTRLLAFTDLDTVISGDRSPDGLTAPPQSRPPRSL